MLASRAAESVEVSARRLTSGAKTTILIFLVEESKLGVHDLEAYVSDERNNARCM